MDPLATVHTTCMYRYQVCVSSKLTCWFGRLAIFRKANFKLVPPS